MSATVELVQAIKKELKSARMTYADLAQALCMAESSVKRMFSKGEMTLSRIDSICRVLKMEFSELAKIVADAQPVLGSLSEEQELTVVADKKLLLVATCVLSLWTFDQMVSRYRISEAECISLLAKLDHLGIIELKPFNRYRLKLSKTFKWRPHGPVMNFFRENALLDYFSSGFNGDGEGLLLVHGSIAKSQAPAFFERLQRVAQDFSQQHLADQKMPDEHRDGYTLVMALRSWEYSAFEQLRR